MRANQPSSPALSPSQPSPAVAPFVGAIVEASAIPLELRGVIALFREQLDGVAFPDLDTARLTQLGDVAVRCAHDVVAAERALRVAEQAAEQALESLRAGAKRGLAYARIYADAHPDRAVILAAIDALATPARAATTEPRRLRGRPPTLASAQLFSSGGAVGGAPTAPPGSSTIDRASADA